MALGVGASFRANVVGAKKVLNCHPGRRDGHPHQRLRVAAVHAVPAWAGDAALAEGHRQAGDVHGRPRPQGRRRRLCLRLGGRRHAGYRLWN